MKYLVIFLILIGFAVTSQAFAIGSPPPERVPATSYHILDAVGNSVDVINVGKQITLSVDLANAQEKEQFVIYLVEIYDYKEVKVYSGTIEGTLEPQMSFSPTVSWIPEKTGYYSVKFRILEDLKTQSALSPDLNVEFHVIREGLDATKTRQWLYQERECPNGKEVATKYDKSKNVCVFPNTLQKLIERGWTISQSNILIPDNATLIEDYKDAPEVKAFYTKYEDAKVEVRDDYLSYFAGSEDESHVRMNLFFNENYELDHIDFHCYFQREHQFELAQEDITTSLEKYECKKYGTIEFSGIVKPELEINSLEIKIQGEKQVRRGTTHTIEIQVVRGDNPIEDAQVFLDIEDYGENIVKEFYGHTNSQGYLIFSWEIPQRFNDIETLLAIVDVTDNNSAKTEVFKFQVYCLPGEKDCKVEGN